MRSLTAVRTPRHGLRRGRLQSIEPPTRSGESGASEVTGLHAVNLVADISDAAALAPIVIVDLSLTARIDAVGLGTLVAGARTCRERGSELRIVGANGMVAQALRFTGLSRSLSTHATVEDALRGM